MARPSPCNGLCSFERRTGFCMGCARTRDEIVGWRDATDDARDKIVSTLDARRARLGRVRRLPWSQEEIGTFVVAALESGGTWVIGVDGAIGAFRRGPSEAIDVAIAGDSIVARGGQSAFSLRLSSKVRAYSVSSSCEDPRSFSPRSFLSSFVVIAVARTCAVDDGGLGLSLLGADADTLLDAGRQETLFDFGLDDRAARFGVRTADRHLSRRLEGHLGDGWPVFFPALSEELARVAPTRVVRGPIGRVEVSTPLWSGRPPAGSYAHFLPPRLQYLGAGVPAAEIVDSYVPCAVHYPA